MVHRHRHTQITIKLYKMNKFLRASLLLTLVLTSCTEDYKLSGLNSEQQSIFTKLTKTDTGIDFTNELIENMKFNGLQYEYYYNGSGLAVADFNNDGLKDVFFVSTLQQHKLFLNEGNLKFKDVSNMTGILLRQRFSGGITIVDINVDGWMDIYISNSGKYNDEEKRKNKLYINMGAKNKERIPTFSEQADKYGLDLTDCSTQAVFFDYDRDGDLDMYQLNHSPTTYPENITIAALANMDGGVANDRLLRNDNNFFKDVSKEAGIVHSRLDYGLGVAVGDINNDGWPDLYVSNDYSGKDHMYINNANGTFSDRILEATNHISFFAMGNDMADINNDGWMDIMTLDMMGESSYDIKTSMSGMNPKKFYEALDAGLHHQYMYNTLQINSGYLNENNVPIFSDIAQLAGVSKTDWSWAPLFFDMDNDGLKDLFVSNGIKRDFRNNDFVNYVNKKQDSIINNQAFDLQKYITDILDKMPVRKKENYFFRNKGDFEFAKMNGTWGDETMTSSNGAVYADLDNDGDLEIVVNNTDDEAFILKNNSREMGLGHYLSFKLKGPLGNRDGIGTKIVVSAGDSRQVQELYFTRGFMSSMARELHFGLGNSPEANVEIIWPDGRQQLLNNVDTDQLLVLDYANSKSSTVKEDANMNQPIFSKNTEDPLPFLHVENEFDDYGRESLLPHKMSQEGPSLAVGDINGDGLDDVHIGGATGFPGVLFVQNEDGSFTKTNVDLLNRDSGFEDVASEFLDVDGDNDLDLYVVSGGNEYDQGNSLLQDRLYINNGMGQFNNLADGLPKNAISGSCIKAVDYDNDGDLDMFVGGRQVPGKYPAPAKSYLLQNNSKEGKIVFDEVPILDGQNLGMVTAAVWVDINNDSYMDLLVTGEWMPVRIFENVEGKRFVENTKKYGLENTNGWWYSLAVGDFDSDGDMDIIGGNLGLNYKYRAAADAPFEVFADDFDQSGSNDIVLGYYDEDKLVPLRGRQCSSEQLPFIKEKFPTYDSFGKAAIGDIFEEEQLEKSTHLRAYTFATTYFENQGGTFVMKKFENAAQMSAVKDILIQDFDKDGLEDVLLVGNLYTSEVETPRNDAAYGLVLKGDGQGNFRAMPARESGLMVRGEVKNAKMLTIKGSRNIIFAKNDEALEVFSVGSR